jgi:hypothetical protein
MKVAPCEKRISRFEVSLCLSRACLGKTIICWYKMAQKICVFRTNPHPYAQDARLRKGTVLDRQGLRGLVPAERTVPEIKRRAKSSGNKTQAYCCAE